MNYWIFQDNPSSFNMDNYIKENLVIHWDLNSLNIKTRSVSTI